MVVEAKPLVGTVAGVATIVRAAGDDGVQRGVSNSWNKGIPKVENYWNRNVASYGNRSGVVGSTVRGTARAWNAAIPAIQDTWNTWVGGK